MITLFISVPLVWVVVYHALQELHVTPVMQVVLFQYSIITYAQLPALTNSTKLVKVVLLVILIAIIA